MSKAARLGIRCSRKHISWVSVVGGRRKVAVFRSVFPSKLQTKIPMCAERNQTSKSKPALSFKDLGDLNWAVILWMDEILHHLETMGNVVCWHLQGNHPFRAC